MPKLGVEAALVGGKLVPGDIEVVDGDIAGYGLPSPHGRGIASPGFVDLQVNGFGGVDLLEADTDGFRRAGDALLETGVTAYLPTFITAPEDDVLRALHAPSTFRRRAASSRCSPRGPVHRPRSARRSSTCAPSRP